MAQDKTEKPDAFKAVIAAKKLDFGRTDLPHQSRGRDLTAAEDALAGALMEIYAAGATGPEAVAKGVDGTGCGSPRFRVVGLDGRKRGRRACRAECRSGQGI